MRKLIYGTTLTCLKCNFRKITIESGVSSLIISTNDESQKHNIVVLCVDHNFYWVFRVILDEAYRPLSFVIVRKVKVGPNSFDVGWLVYILNQIRLILFVVASCEVIETLPLPNGQETIAHSDVIVLFVR